MTTATESVSARVNSGALSHIRRKPGRPRSGHVAGTSHSEVPSNPGPKDSALVLQTTAPRLLDLPAAAAYLAVSVWTVRDLEASGVLPRVRIPLPHGREVRKLLFDIRDLDRLVEAWKDRTEGEEVRW